MTEFARCLRLSIEKREKMERRETPSQAFRRCFGPEYGVELLLPRSYGYEPVALPDGGKAPRPVHRHTR